MATDKHKKLKRYNRKDYTQVVEFPVEIVGSDGVIRRYSFEESVRLYQRRIASAALRYGDGEVVTAEVQHCRRRIEQLRKSYFARYGWDAIRAVDSPGILAGEFAGEVAAFLRRCLDGHTSLEPESLEFTYLEEGEHRKVFFVQQRLGETTTSGSEPESYLLYLFRFDLQGSEQPREAFFSFLKVLQSVRQGGDGIEVLVAFHHSADCGLVLTGQRGTVRESTSPNLSEDLGFELAVPEAPRRDVLREGLALFRQQKREEALARFTEAYVQNHYQRRGYLGAAVVADQLGQSEEGEAATRMGLHYFPKDPALEYHLALGLLRQGRASEALTLLESDTDDEVSGFAWAVLTGATAMMLGQHWRAWRLLSVRPSGENLAAADVSRAHRWLRHQLRARAVLLVLGMAMIATGFVVLAHDLSWGFALVVGGAVMAPLVHQIWRRQLQAMMALPGIAGLRLACPSMLRSTKARDPSPSE